MTREFLFTLGGFHIWSVLELDSSWRQTKRRAAAEGEVKKQNKKPQHTAQHRFPILSSVISVICAIEARSETRKRK